MESQLKNQPDLLKQIKNLRAEKELLEKHVGVLNNCLSVDELKSKISTLEKKRELLSSLENVIKKLREDVEPLNYLKSVLKQKLEYECLFSTKSEDVKPSAPKLDMDFPNYRTLSDSALSQRIAQTPNVPIDWSDTNDYSVEECIQIFDQYDVVSDQEILGLPTECSSKFSSVQKEPSTSSINNIKNEIQDKPTATTSTYFDAKDRNVQLSNDQNESNEDEIKSEEIMENIKTSMNTSSSKKKSTQNAKTSSLTDKKDDFLQKEVTEFLGGCEKLLSKTVPKLLNTANEVINVPELLTNANECLKVTNKIETNEQADSSQPQLLNEISESNIYSFNNMNLKIDLLRGLYSFGFINPTILQQRSVVHCLKGQDAIVLAKPGSGTTMLFTIPLLQKINTDLIECQALILVPTRDLAVHIQKIIMSVGDFMGVNVCIGGDNVPRKLSVVPHIVIGTPAGVSKMISCNSLRTEYIETIVLNKVDKMLSNNYNTLIEEVMAKLVRNKQVILLTSEKLDHVLDKYMDSLRDPLILIDDDEKENKKEILKNLPKQFYLNSKEVWKILSLTEIISELKLQKAIIFCNTMDKARQLSASLQRYKFAASLFNFEMNAREREEKLNMFSSDNLKILVTSEPIKGNQFHQAAWIINFDLPINLTCYLDRISKCSENIRVINFITETDNSTKLAIETNNKSSMIEVPSDIIDILKY